MSHYDIHVGDVIKYPEMVMARTVKCVKVIQEVKVLLLFIITMIMADFLTLSYQCVFHVNFVVFNFCFAFFLWYPF